MIEKLKKILREDQILSSKNDLLFFDIDASLIDGESFFVLRPESKEEIQNIVVLAKRYDFSITIRGSGTSLSGNSTPNKNIVLDMSYFNKIKIVNTKEKWIEVESFVNVYDINKVLESKNLFFPIVSKSQKVASVGGMISTNATGIYSYKYGNIGLFVEGLEYIDGTGKIFYINENNSFKDLIESEGCFGIITKARLKLVEKINKKEIKEFSFLSAKDVVKKIEDLKKNVYFDKILNVEFISKAASIDNRYYLLVVYDVSNVETKIEQSSKFEIIKNKFKKVLNYEVNEKKSNYPWDYVDYEQKNLILKKYNELDFKFAQRNYNFVSDPVIPFEHLYDFIRFCELNDIISYGYLGRGHFILRFRNYQKDLIKKMYEFVFELGGRISGSFGIGLEKKVFLNEEDKLNFCEKKYKHDYNNILNRDKVVSSTFFEGFKTKKDVLREKDLAKKFR